MRDVVPIFLHVPRPEIAYVKFIFESYEGVAVCRTLDRFKATIVVLAAPDFEADVRRVVAALATEAPGVVEIPAPPGDGDWLGPPEPYEEIPR